MTYFLPGYGPWQDTGEGVVGLLKMPFIAHIDEDSSAGLGPRT